MQAQETHDPYVGLWTRLEGFDPHELGRLVADRRAVRSPLMRATIHLVSARDCLTLAPLLRPLLERQFWTGTPFGRRLKGVDVEAVVAAGRALLEERPRTTAQLRSHLGERWPADDASSLAYAVHHLVAVVPLPPPGAFGPAGVMDVQAWSGLTRLREVIDRLRPRLRTFRSEAGKELFDLPDAPRPDPDTPAPVRFLPQFDNVALSHADRGHIAADAAARWPADGLHWSPLLVDGFVSGAWRLARDGKAATLTVRPLAPLSAQDRAALAGEAERLLGFLAADAEPREVRLAAAT